LGKYIDTIEKNILSVFDRSQLHICITEWLKKNTVEEMNKIYDFLNLERIDIERKRVNPFDKSYIIKPASKSMEVRRAEPWYRVWDINPETVTGELRKQGLEFYKKSNERLFDFLGYDIPEWRV